MNENFIVFGVGIGILVGFVMLWVMDRLMKRLEQWLHTVGQSYMPPPDQLMRYFQVMTPDERAEFEANRRIMMILMLVMGFIIMVGTLVSVLATLSGSFDLVWSSLGSMIVGVVIYLGVSIVPALKERRQLRRITPRLQNLTGLDTEPTAAT